MDKFTKRKGKYTQIGEILTYFCLYLRDYADKKLVVYK